MDFEQYSDDLRTLELFPNGKVFRLLFDPTVQKMKIIAKHQELLEDLRKAFSAENTASFFVSRYGYKVEPRVYAINKFGYFDAGLLFDILEYVRNNFGTLGCIAISPACKQYIDDFVTPLKKMINDFKLSDLKVSNISEDTGKNNELRRLGKTPFEFRDYQEASVRNLILRGYGRGLIEIPTAGGKSFILANFIWNIHKNFDSNYKYLILVPNKQLVEQFYKDLIDYGYHRSNVTRFTAGLRGTDKFNPEAKIIIANRQFLFKNTDKLPKVDVLICDEVHQSIAEATRDFIGKINCKIKVGCSGTLPRDKYQMWTLTGMFSRVVHTEDVVNLQNSGFISKLDITLLRVTDSVIEGDRNLLFHTNSLRKYRPDEFGYSEVEFNEAYNAEHDYFAKHFNDLYKPVLEYASGLTGNTLILFDKLDIGKSIFDLFVEMHPEKTCFYNDGSTDIKLREDVRNKFESGDGNFLFANAQIMSTGINIKRLHNLVFCFNSKSTSRIIQSIGRILRLYNDKSCARLIDCVFNTKYSQKHYSERTKLYKQFYNKSKPDKVIDVKI